MPIYEYRCASCGFEKDYLQKVSDPLLTHCPDCGKATFEKQVTAAGFQLKGNGWYATDFKDSGKKPAAEKKPGTEGEKSATTTDKPASTTDKPASEDKPAKKEEKSEKSEST